MKVFDFKDYKEFTRAKIKSMPHRGRGQLSQIAKLLSIHTTMVTHIFRGNSQLSIEQSLKLSGFFGLNEIETEYFVTLVQYERVANEESREFFGTQLSRLKDRALNLSERILVKKVLDEKDQAVFYSAWFFSAIRLLVAIEGFHEREAIAAHLSLPNRIVNRAVDFLISAGLCQEKNGKLSIREVTTYVGRDSLFVGRHHTNWRMRSVEQFNNILPDELVFTNPITLSQIDFMKIREELVRVIEKFRAIADPSPPEKLCCLNIDWIQVRSPK